MVRTGFDDARTDRIFNRRLAERSPAAVLRAETEQDVVLGVRLARERGWQVAVRSGGHSWAQWSVRDEALVIDLGGLRELSYDETTGIVSASPAIKGGSELAPYLDSFGRFFPGGHCPTVGIGGFLLQGGQGWNARGWGWAAEYVEAIDVVTADGELVRADAEQNADLYWAARGAGPGFFGVVTRFHLRTLPAPRHIAQTVQAFALDDFDEVMTWLHEAHHSVADTVEIVALTKTDHALSHDPVLLVTGVALVDDEAEADAALAPFRDNPALDRALMVVDAVPTTLEEQRKRQLEDNPEGHRWAVDNAWLTGPADGGAAGDAPRVHDPAERQGVHDLVQHGAAARAARHGVLDAVGDLPRVVRAVGGPGRGRAARAVAARRDGRPRAGDGGPVPRRRRPEPAPGEVPLRRRTGPGCRRSASQRDPDGVFVGYLAGPDGAANANHFADRNG